MAIAEEKAGIIKPESHLVLGETDPDLQAVFTAEGPAATWVRDDDFGCEANRVAVGGRLVDLRTPSGRVEDVYLPVHGAHQGDNAALALAVGRGVLRRAHRGGGRHRGVRRPRAPRAVRGGAAANRPS